MIKKVVNAGDVYGYLTVISEIEGRISKGGNSKRQVSLTCVCGKVLNRVLDNLKENSSCGCMKVHSGGRVAAKRGEYDFKIYNTWVKIKQRCYNPKDKNYHNYGGRGIKVCDRWINSFDNFLEDMGVKPSIDYSLDRIDVNGDYCKGNCRWATAKQQNNNRRDNVFYLYNGSKMTLSEISDMLGINYQLLRQRVSNGMELQSAIDLGDNKKVSLIISNSLKNKCLELGISYSIINHIKQRKNLSNEMAISYYFNRKK